MKRLLLILLITTVGISQLLAFGQSERDDESLRLAMSGNPDTLDPQATPGTLTFQVTRSIYDTLVEPDVDGEIVPALAASWEADDDATVWTFHLREGVRFHHGADLSADDVVATFERMLDEEFASPNADELGPIENIQAIDDHTVRITLGEPYAPLLASLASSWSAILPADLVEEEHDFGAVPVGTGPFRFREWVQDSRIVLDRHDGYWMDGAPQIGGVVFFIIEEPSVQLQGLLTGDFDVIDTVQPESLDRVREHPETRLDETLSSLAMVLSMNTRREPLDSVDVRRAITHAVNKEQVLDIAYGGGEVGGTFMDTGDVYHRDFSDRYPYDPDAARELLAGADADVGRTLTIAVPQNYEAHVNAGQLYQQMLEDVGLDVELKLVEWSTWLSDVYGDGDFDLTVIGHTGKLDPEGRLGDLTSERFYTGWQNAEFNELVRAARRTADVEERQELYAEALEILAEEVPMVFTGTNYRYIGLRRHVRDFHMDGKLDTYDFRRVHFLNE